jgi:hypothetical protein
MGESVVDPLVQLRKVLPNHGIMMFCTIVVDVTTALLEANAVPIGIGNTSLKGSIVNTCSAIFAMNEECVGILTGVPPV